MKKITTLFVGMLMFATVLTVAATEIDKNPGSVGLVSPTSATDDPWDIIDIYDIGATGETGANGNAGAEFDGTYLYSTRWAANLIHRYDIDGNLVEEFSIPGVTGLRDLAYDGTAYMYGGAAAGTIWKMDFTTKTLVATLSGGFQSRAIAYNWDEDVIYCSNWADPVWEVDPTTGGILGTFNLGTATSTYGFAYDPNPDGNNYLWVFDQTTGATSTIYQWDLGAGAMTGFTYNVNNDVGSGVGIAGGLWASPDYAPGLFCIGGCVQDSSAPGVTDWLFAYELYTTNPLPAVPSIPDGPDEGKTGLEYEFSSSTTDPEGEDIYIMFDWGDGTFSDWIGPEPSGSTISDTHIWTEGDVYEVRARAKDASGGMSAWSDPHEITIEEAVILEIQEIGGKIGRVTVKVKNIGVSDATDITWTIALDGGLIILGKESTGTIPILNAGVSADFQSKFIFGIGKPTITVTVEAEGEIFEATATATVLLFFVTVA